jgi:acylphosphatase
MKRLEATIYGRVQGVSFRYYTRREAQQLNVTGWVANKADGTVRIVAEGPESRLRQLLDFLEEGSPAARVERLETNWADATNEFSRFGVRRL